MHAPRWLPLAGLILLSTLGSGCKATCADVCDKLVDCDGLPTQRMSSAECEESCKQQSELYDDWADVQKQDAFQAELDCLRDETCEDIAADACYDETTWAY